MASLKDHTGGLTKRALDFVRLYREIRNGKEAAIKAGYSPRTAKQSATRLLKDQRVKDAIEREDQEVAAKANITATRALIHTAQIAYASLDDSRVKVSEKLKALELILKCTGAFAPEAVDVTHHVETPPPVIELVPFTPQDKQQNEELTFVEPSGEPTD